jgi:hypothetical protein
MVADQMGVQFDVGRGCPMIAKRVATQGLAYLLATDDRQTDVHPGRSFEKEPVAAEREMPQKSR